MAASLNSAWSDYCLQLAVMIDAGLTIESALKTLQDSTPEKDKRIKQNLNSVIGLVRRGKSLSQSLKQTDSIVSSDFTILNIAEKSGKLPKGLNAIAKRRRDWIQKLDNLKANLLLPKVILLIGAFAGLFVRVLSVEQTIFVALIEITTALIFTWLLILLTAWLIERDGLLWLSLGWRLPFFRSRFLTYQLAFEDAFYRLLSWQIESGIAPDQAFKASKSLLSASDYQSKIESAARKAQKGDSISNILAPLILTKPLYRVIVTAEQVGSWDRAVIHHLDQQKKVLALKADAFFKWLPRFYYLIAILAISKFMFA